MKLLYYNEMTHLIQGHWLLKCTNRLIEKPQWYSNLLGKERFVIDYENLHLLIIFNKCFSNNDQFEIILIDTNLVSGDIQTSIFLRTIQYILIIMKHWPLKWSINNYYLLEHRRTEEQECGGLIFNTCTHENFLDIFSPIIHGYPFTISTIESWKPPQI